MKVLAGAVIVSVVVFKMWEYRARRKKYVWIRECAP